VTRLDWAIIALYFVTAARVCTGGLMIASLVVSVVL